MATLKAIPKRDSFWTAFANEGLSDVVNAQPLRACSRITPRFGVHPQFWRDRGFDGEGSRLHRHEVGGLYTTPDVPVLQLFMRAPAWPSALKTWS